MTTIPIAWLISVFAVLIAGIVVTLPKLPIVARGFFALALLCIALVTGLVGLRLEYGLAELARLQPHLSILTAPALWLGFQSLTRTSGRPARTTLLSVGALVAAGQIAMLVFGARAADPVITLLNIGFVAALARMLRYDADSFVQVAPEGMRALRTALVAGTVFFAFVLVADIAIIAATLSGGDAGMLRFLSGTSGALVGLAFLGMLIGMPLSLGPPRSTAARLSAPQETQAEDTAVLAKIDALMSNTRLYTDPGLNLARLGRRAGLPARIVSETINRATGENVSRYINGFRVRHAADLLTGTDLPVTDVMLESGFLSKSSFNTEFRRVTGDTPSDHRKQHSG